MNEPETQRMPGKASYPAQWQHVGCSMCDYKIMGPFVTGRDDAAFDAARMKVREHIKATHAAVKK